jgi:predicted CoA-binding protein
MQYTFEMKLARALGQPVIRSAGYDQPQMSAGAREMIDRWNDWKRHLVDDDAGITELLAQTRRIAVIGIKPESHASQPAHYVPAYLQRAGFDVIPVPTYYPEVIEILGRPVVRRLAEIDGEIDIVNLFRRPADVAMHVDEILAARPKAVWMQQGIRNDEAAECFAKAGIKVVQDRCLMVSHRDRS